MSRETLRGDVDHLNELQLWDFTCARLDNGNVLVLGSTNFSYYHLVEAEFSGVTFCDLPESFSHAEFRLGAADGDTEVDLYVFAEVDIEQETFRIRAHDVEMRFGTVYYYLREGLKEGERIAPWVRRES